MRGLLGNIDGEEGVIRIQSEIPRIEALLERASPAVSAPVSLSHSRITRQT